MRRVSLFLVFACLLPYLALAAPLTPAQVATYTAQLQDNDAERMQLAANALAADKQVGALLAALKSDDKARRTCVIYALPQCLTPAAMDALIAVVTKDPDARVRNTALSIASAAVARPELKEKQAALLAACKAATRDTDAFVACNAVINITKMQPDCTDLLLDILANGPNPMARSQAAGMLVMPDRKDPRIYDALVKAVADPETEPSSRAISALGKLGDQRAAPLLLHVLQDQTRHPQLPTNASQALADLAAPEVLEPLLALATTGTPAQRERALTALGGYPDPRVGPVMINGLASDNPMVRRQAASVLAAIKYAPAAMALLAQVRNEPVVTPRREMLRALAELKEPRAREFFAAAALNDRDEQVMLIGAQGVLALNDDRAFEVLAAKLKAQSISTYAIIRLLGNSDNPRAIEILLPYYQQLWEQRPNVGYGDEEDAAVRKLTGGGLSDMAQARGVNRTAPITIGIRFLDATPQWHGEVVTALVTLYNWSKAAVVVQELVPTLHHGEDPIVLSGNVPGEVAARDGGYVYIPRPQQLSRLPLHAGLLLPGQAMQVQVTYRPVGANERFLVRYLEAAQPYDGTPASLAPLTVCIPDGATAGADGMRTFVPFTDAGWRAVTKTMPVATPVGPDAAVRAVVVVAPDAARKEEPMMAYPCIPHAQFYLLDQARRDAARLTGKPAMDLALGYSTALNGYVLVDGAVRWLLPDTRTEARGKALPAFPLSLLKDVDRGSARIQVDPNPPAAAGGTFWDRYPIEPGDGMSIRGQLITLTPAQLPEFLNALLARKGSLERHDDYFRSRYYVLK